MKIKVTKSESVNSWYADRIGETFNVIETDDYKNHHIVHKGRLLNSVIRFEDCEILNEDKKP